MEYDYSSELPNFYMNEEFWVKVEVLELIVL